MKKFTLAALAAVTLALLFVLTVPVFAQEDRPHPDDKAAQEDKHPDQKADQKDEDKNLRRDEKDDRDRDIKQEQDKKEVRDQKDEHQDKDIRRDEARETHTDRRIPDDRFRAHFGREHVFVINRPVIVEGAPRFQYGGYWFVIANPWPVGWAYTDQVYVDYIDGGYYLLSPVHPGVQVSINVVF